MYQRVLVPTDMSEFANHALRYAAAFRENLGSELTLIYADEIRHWIDPQIADRCVFRNLVLPDGDPAQRTLEAATEWNADLIVVGAQHRFFSDATVIGTTTQRITRFARIPVLTVSMKARKEVQETIRETAGVM